MNWKKRSVGAKPEHLLLARREFKNALVNFNFINLKTSKKEFAVSTDIQPFNQNYRSEFKKKGPL